MTTEKKLTLSEKLEKLVQPLSKVAQNKYTTALRDGFALALPFTIAGAMAVLFMTIVFGGWGAEKTSLLGLIAHASGNTVTHFNHLFDSSTGWEITGKFKEASIYGQQIFAWVNSATLGSISLYVPILVGYSLAVIRRMESPALSGAFSLAIFLVITGGNSSLFGTSGMLSAIIAGLGGTSLYIAIVKSKMLELRLPSSVPPAVGKAFGVLLPGFVACTIFALVNVLVSVPYLAMTHQTLTNGSQLFTISHVINDVVLQPFMIFAKSGGDIAILLVYLFFSAFFFFFGIHGPNTLGGAITPISILLWVDNMSGGNNVAIEQVWSGFGIFGGTGGTLMLVIWSLILLSKGSPTREVSKFALPAGIFEINEPVIFGFPIMFNPTYFIPFVLAGPISVSWAIMAIKLGWMNAPTLSAPWTTPPILYGLIVTQFDWRSIIVSLLALITQALIWLPFVLWQRKQDADLHNIEVESFREKAKKVKLRMKGNK